jgi:hypothetical protein
MAKALKYFFEFSDIDADDYKVEIWVEGFAGTATELIAGGNPLTRTYNKDVGEKYLGGIVPSVISIEAISNASFHAVDFTGQNYGDAVAVVYKNTVLQYNAIIVPFEGSDSDLNDGIYSVNLSAECGLVNLKTIIFLPSGTRKKLLDVIIECINNIPYVNSFGYSVVDNVDLRDADLNKPYYYESFIEDKFFEGLSCYDVINSIIQQYGQFTFTDGRWDIKNIAEISKVNSVKRTYSNAGVLQSSTTYTRPDESVTRIAGGDFGLMFSQKSVTIEKAKSISRSLNPNSGFDNPTGWTFEGLAPLLFEITNGYLTNKGNTWFTEPSNLPDSSYVQSPPTTYFPFKSSFELTPKQEIKIKFKSTKGSFIKNLRLQIIAVQDLDVNFYYLTNEGSWYRAVSGVNTPIYAADFKDGVEEVITVPQVPFLLPDTPPVLSNVIPVYGEFMPYPYLNAVSDLPYKIYVRVFMPERLGDDFPTGATALDLTTQIDYIHITAEEINNDSLNGFTKKFGVVSQKDRSGDLTIKLGVGYPSFPVAYDSLFFNGSTTKPITLYNSLPIEEFIADSYLSVLSQRQKFYQGTVIANIEFGDLLDIDGEKHRIHNYEYNYKLKQANIKTIGLGVNADTIEELPVYDSDVNLDIDSILNQVDIDMNRKYGDNLNLKFVDKNIQINTLADGQKSLSLRQDFRISRLYSTDVFLRTASDGSIQDVAEDTEGNFTLIKPAKDGTYALLEDIEDLAWLQEGNTATVATKKLGTLDNFDFNIIRNNVNIGQIKSTGLDLLDNRLDVGAVQYNVATAQTVGVAKTIWNDTFGTLEFGLKGGNVNYRLGQSSIVYVKSADNAGLTKGTVVYTAGSDGINKTVRLAQANAESTSSKTFGIIAETVSGGEKAFCTTFGNLEGINTSAFAEGATIYLSPTVAGGLTTTKPSAPNHMVVVGFCLRSHATQGVIFVKVQNGFELDEIHDVAIGTLANNNLLAYESSTSLWKNKTFAELGIAAGTGTTNFVTKWSNATGGLTNSQIFDNGVNVGIGTPSPIAKLHILSSSSTIATIESSASQAFFGLKAVSGGVVYFGNNNSGDFTIQTAGSGYSDKFYITSAGNVGIGTPDPTQRLDVNGTSRTTNLMITNGAAVGKVWQCNNVNGAGEWVTPLSSERYIGEWAANSGVAPSASPTTGDYYVVNTAGTYLGITYAAGDEIYWNGTAWLKRSNFLTLPIATASILGGIKVGTGLSIDGSGVVSVASLATARTISATGDGTWSVSFNGGADVSGALTLANVATAGTYRSVTINAKGLVTAGTNPTTVSGYGITDFFAQIVSGFVTGANSTVLNTDSLEVALEKLQGQINARISGNQTITLSGIITGSGTTAITTAIADGALSIAKTSGLQTALDGKLTIPTVLTTNFVSKWGGSAFANSQIFDNGTNVGVGTVSPANKLHILSSSSTIATIESSASQAFFGLKAVSGGVVYFGNNNSGDFTIQTAGSGYSDKLYITSSGNVGIGTSSPSTRLTVAGTVSINTAVQSLVMNSASGVYSTYQHNGTSIGDIGTSNQAFSGGLTADFGITSRAGKLALGTGSVVRMVIDTAGKIGINNLEPTYTLDVLGTTRTTNLLITSGATSGNFLKCNNVNGTSVWSSVTTSDITNLSSFTGFDSRYFTETESDARFVALAGNYVNPSWITSLAWTKLTGVPTTFAPSAHTHAAVDIVSGVIATARLAESGTASATTFLRGDQTWATLPAPTLTSTRIGFGSGSNLLTSSANFVFEDDRIIAIKEGTTSKMEVARYVGSSNYGLYVTGGNLELQSLTGGTVISKSNHNFQGSILLNNLPGTAGQVLTSQGSGANPTWTTVSSGSIPTLNQIIVAHTGDFAGVLTSTTNNGGFAVKAVGGADIGGMVRNFNDLNVFSGTGIGVSNVNIVSSYTVFLKANDANGRINLQCTNDIKLAGSFIELNSNLVKISNTPFKLALSDFAGGIYTPANGDKILITYDGSKSAFVLQKINILLSGGISYLTL